MECLQGPARLASDHVCCLASGSALEAAHLNQACPKFLYTSGCQNLVTVCELLHFAFVIL